MTVFKSKIENALPAFVIVSLFYGACFWIILQFAPEIRALLPAKELLLVIYLIIVILYLGITNNDIVVYEDRLEIVNHLPLFKKRIAIPFDQIKTVTFRQEWTNFFEKRAQNLRLEAFLVLFAGFFFPFDYKWIKISGDKNYTVYCFGLERDYFTNKGPLFEDLFDLLSKKGLDVRWTA